MDGTCLVTGGAGFIGCALSSRLADRFDRVVALDNLHPQVHAERRRPASLDRRVKLVVGDVCDAKAWDALLADVAPTSVIHLAAETGTGQSLREATRHSHVNVTGTTQMLDAFARRRRIPERIVLTSSRAVYGEGAWRKSGLDAPIYPGQRTRAQLERNEWDFPGLEPLPFSAAVTSPRPISVYGATKLAQEHVLRAWAYAFGVRPIVLRLQNVYGPGQSLSNPYTGICSLFARVARGGESVPVYEDGRIVRDFVYIDDVANAIIASLDVETPLADAYDVGSGVATTIAELAELIAEHYGAPAPHVTAAFRHGDVRHAACLIDRTCDELEWAPRTSLREGVARLCGWIGSQLGSDERRVSAA